MKKQKGLHATIISASNNTIGFMLEQPRKAPKEGDILIVTVQSKEKFEMLDSSQPAPHVTKTIARGKVIDVAEGVVSIKPIPTSINIAELQGLASSKANIEFCVVDNQKIYNSNIIERIIPTFIVTSILISLALLFWGNGLNEVIKNAIGTVTAFTSESINLNIIYFESYPPLPLKHNLFWFAVCLPFWYMGFKSLKKTVAEHPEAISILSISGAFFFVSFSLKLPSFTGWCSHMTGTGLAAILFGPTAVSILGVIVLIFSALLLAHGGLPTLGTNTFSVAIAGPILAYLIYQAMTKAGVKKSISVFLAAVLGDLFTFCVTALQVAVAYPAADGGIATSIVKLMGVFFPTQIPIAIIEGLLTTAIILGLELYAKSELTDIGFLNTKTTSNQSVLNSVFSNKVIVLLLVIASLIALVPFFVLGRVADSTASDEVSSETIAEVLGNQYESGKEKAFGSELPNELESLLFILQVGIGTGIIAYVMGRFYERKKHEKGDNQKKEQTIHHIN